MLDNLNNPCFANPSCRKISVGLASTAECLHKVKEFLDREGTALSNEQEFIPFFALPFVQDPAEHPTFKGLFQVCHLLLLHNL